MIDNLRKILQTILITFIFAVVALPKDKAQIGYPFVKPISFKTKTHSKLNMKILIRVLNLENLDKKNRGLSRCGKHLKRTQWRQDLLLSFHSKAHFDNCSFESSFRYVNKLLKRNEEAYQKMLKHKTPGKKKKYLKKILRRSGKILHAIQDFYSHSNYVEWAQKNHFSFESIPKIEFWNSQGQERIILLAKESLVTGKVWWGFPKKCRKGSLSHGKLSKDSAKSRSGKRLTLWKNPTTNRKLSAYQAAISLAEDASYEFLLHTFSEYPMLREYCDSANS